MFWLQKANGVHEKRFRNGNQSIRQIIENIPIHFQKFVSSFLFFLSNQILHLRPLRFLQYPDAPPFFIPKHPMSWNAFFSIINISPFLIARNSELLVNPIRGVNLWDISMRFWLKVNGDLSSCLRCITLQKGHFLKVQINVPICLANICKHGRSGDFIQFLLISVLALFWDAGEHRGPAHCLCGDQHSTSVEPHSWNVLKD